jgi:osmotically-inducible protein OsmY
MDAIRKTDSEIQQDVLRELKWDTRVDEAAVGVAVKDGVVTLTGTVSSLAKKMAAQEAAHRVGGVLDVANDIQIKTPDSLARTDPEIAQAVRHALVWNDFVPDRRIRSTVSDGIITLEGEVDYWSQREDAERSIRNLVGVRGVKNQIQIKPAPVAQDIRKSIQEALERHAEHEAKRIQVLVSDGKVTLSGAVDSWTEKQAVLGAARGTLGVYDIEDQVRIEL